MRILLSALTPAFFVALIEAGPCHASDLVLADAKIYPSPTDAPIENASILIRDGRILA